MAPIRASVADAIVVLLDRLPDSRPVSFRMLVAGITERLDVIVRFLAVLELYKQGVVDLEQLSNFGDLRVRRLVHGEAALDAASIADWDDPEARSHVADAAADADDDEDFATDDPGTEMRVEMRGEAGIEPGTTAAEQADVDTDVEVGHW